MTTTLLWLTALAATVPAPARLASDVADSMVVHGYYAEAASEYRRALFLEGDDSAVDAATTRLKLGIALGSAGRTADAVRELHAARDGRTSLALSAQLAAAGFYARRADFEQAQAEVSDLLVFSRESAEANGLQRYAAWLSLRQGDVAASAAGFRRAGDTTLSNRIRQSAAPGTRSPNLAMLMSSVIPGTGEMYAGRPAAGLLALAVTGLTVVGIVWAARSDDWVSASVVASTFFWRFYNGSRQNAANFADEFNRAAIDRNVRRISAAEPAWFGPASLATGLKVEPDTSAPPAASGPSRP
jgi:tetratricopeptide (TPR) repeat protein